jgi:hypothetical protein
MAARWVDERPLAKLKRAFGRSRPDPREVTLQGLTGIDEAKVAVLLVGSPCVGKTTLARAIVRETSVPFSGTDTINQLLIDLDGFDRSNVLTIAASIKAGELLLPSSGDLAGGFDAVLARRAAFLDLPLDAKADVALLPREWPSAWRLARKRRQGCRTSASHSADGASRKSRPDWAIRALQSEYRGR